MKILLVLLLIFLLFGGCSLWLFRSQPVIPGGGDSESVYTLTISSSDEQMSVVVNGRAQGLTPVVLEAWQLDELLLPELKLREDRVSYKPKNHKPHYQGQQAIRWSKRSINGETRLTKILVAKSDSYLLLYDESGEDLQLSGGLSITVLDQYGKPAKHSGGESGSHSGFGETRHYMTMVFSRHPSTDAK